MIEDYTPFGKTSGGILTRAGSDVGYVRSMDGFRLERYIVDARRVSPRVRLSPGSLLHTVHIHTHNWFYQASLEDFKTKGTPVYVGSRLKWYVLPKQHFLIIDRKELLQI